MSVKVLVVEDDKDFSDLLDFFLHLNGFTVVLATNGKEAIDLAKSEDPHIILMDLNLPVLNGWEATRIISQSPETCGIPIIAVSANCSEKDLNDEALKAGAVRCIRKPVNIEILPDLIKSHALN